MRMGIARGRVAPARPHRTRGGLAVLAGCALAAALLAGAAARAQTAGADEVASPTPPRAAPEDVLSAPSPRIVALTGEDAAPGPAGAQARAGADDGAMAAAGPSGGVPAPAGAPSGDVLEVFLDHAKIIRLPERTQTVIVGNPFIADVTVQRNGILVVTGKSYGATNLIALDPQGLLLAESMVSVRAPTDSVVVVQRGLARESYSCTPNCQPSLRLGDAPDYFGAVGSQATQRSGFAGQAR